MKITGWIIGLAVVRLAVWGGAGPDLAVSGIEQGISNG